MRTQLIILAVLAGGAWFLLMTPVRAQGWNSRDSGSSSHFGSTSYAPTTVSPYLNLGVTPNGLSNYQTLVKPMIDEREALYRQSANIQQLRQQMDVQEVRDSRESLRQNPALRSPSAVRFLHYSHYFGRLP